MQNVHIVIKGKVQGVLFRQHTKKIAVELGLNGFVRNLDDGTVEVQAEGDDNKINKLIVWCKKGPPAARVSSINIIYEECNPKFEDFEIRY